MQTFNEYQDFTKSLAVYNEDVSALIHMPGIEGSHEPYYHEETMPFMYPVLALAEEAGEVAGKVAKYIRKKDTQYLVLRANVGKELGDVAYQLSEAARMFGFTLQDIIDMNVAKLTDRSDRGVLVGEGDDR